MNELRRELAPISAAGWQAIDAEATRALGTALGARRVVDFIGPRGWDFSALGSGRTRSLDTPRPDGVERRLRIALPLIELKAGFTVAREELDAIDRGAPDPALDVVVEAARRVALAEDQAIFHGVAAAEILGICESSAATRTITDDYSEYPEAVAEALSVLRLNGVQGPFALVLGPRCFTGLSRTTVGGYPVIKHIDQLVDGPVVWASGLDGAVVMSLRGGDFELIVGRDFAVGYSGERVGQLEFFIEESFTFRNLGPEAAVTLRYET